MIDQSQNARLLAGYIAGLLSRMKAEGEWPFAAFRLGEYSDPAGFTLEFDTGHRYYIHVGELVPAREKGGTAG